MVYETPDIEIKKLWGEITHIWISHEHPDHFSISFFNSFLDEIIKRKIIVLFQKTKDKRVVNFLRNKGISVRELENKKKYHLSKDFSITCFNYQFYDSILYVESFNEKILNLNDCSISCKSEAEKIYKITRNVDVLLSQFSIAAWKGGVNNQNWRVHAAKEKIASLSFQISYFSPKILIPFASFIFFCNNENFYLNIARNFPSVINESLKNSTAKILFMKPGDTLGRGFINFSNEDAIKFWEKSYNLRLKEKKLTYFSPVSEEEIIEAFHRASMRIKKNNNIFLMLFFRYITPFNIFRPIEIKVSDLDQTYKIDYLRDLIEVSASSPTLSMHSESLFFLFNNSFGFDTMTVNGCFEECHKDGFYKAAKLLAVENLNNLGVFFDFKIILRLRTIKLFLILLYKVRGHLIEHRN